MDLESIAWIQTRLAKLRGLISGDTYRGITDRLNIIHGELTSLKSQVGHAMAECEILRNERDVLQSRVDELSAMLESKSIVETDSAIKAAVEAAQESTGAILTPPGVSGALENGSAEASL